MRAITLGLTTLVGVFVSASSLDAQQLPIRVCVVESGGALREIEAMYNSSTGDTTISGRRFGQAHPAGAAQYSGSARWYINSEPITLSGQRYVKYGLPRVLGVNEVTRVNAFQGVSLFAEAGMTGRPEVLYIPVRPGCEFQPYQIEATQASVSTPPASAAPAATRIQLGQTIRGTLSSSDPRASDDSYYDHYLFTARSGQRVFVSLASEDFDAFLAIGRMSGGEFEEIDSNDDSAGLVTDAGLEIAFPAAGDYVIRANSLNARETGSYSLRVVDATSSASATTVKGGVAGAATPIRAGQSVDGSLATSDPTAADNSYYDHYLYQASAGERVVITMSSSTFDTYLVVGRMRGGQFEEIASNDDGGDGTDSRLEFTFPSDGEYLIRANSLASRTTGRYSLSITARTK